MKRGDVYGFVKRLIAEIHDDDIGVLSAAVAFYTGLSIAPLMILFLWFGGFIGPGAQASLQHEVQDLIGPEGGRAIEMILSNARERPDLGNIASLVSAAVLVFAATGVFNQLQHAMNLIWDVRANPRKRLWGWLRKRLISLAMIASLGFLLVVSLILSAAIAFLGDSAAGGTEGATFLGQVSNTGASFLVFFLLFGALFKFLPDVRIAWRDVWIGASLTALFFVVGKHLIGLYLGRSTLSSSYGAAGTLIVFLLWVYYSALTMFFGAEVTQVWARRHGSGLVPSKHASWDRAPSAKVEA